MSKANDDGNAGNKEIPRKFRLRLAAARLFRSPAVVHDHPTRYIKRGDKGRRKPLG